MKIRQYNLNDYSDILEISKHIWEGNDYLPKLINEYYESPHCDPYVVEEDGRVISVVNVNKYTKNFFWLEAMRTHPDYRNRGIATELNKFLLQQIKKAGIPESEVWLLTSQKNEATGKMLQKAGFEEITLLKLWDNSENLDKQELIRNNGVLEGKLMHISFLPANVSNEITKLVNSWRPVNNKEEVSNILDNKALKGESFVYLVNEFNIFPLASYFVDSWIEKQFIFINEITNSIMTFKPAKERINSYALGIYDFNKDAITSALLFALNQVNTNNNSDIDIKLFYPSAVELKLLDSDWILRIMKKEI